jgi:hypothetical protein
MHPDRETRDRHEAIGFFAGWNLCIDQLEAVALRVGRFFGIAIFAPLDP